MPLVLAGPKCVQVGLKLGKLGASPLTHPLPSGDTSSGVFVYLKLVCVHSLVKERLEIQHGSDSSTLSTLCRGSS